MVLGCSTTFRTNTGLIERLRNRGPIPLSSENPYLAPNLMLTQEMDRSSELRGFINFRGAPAAVEVEQGMFSSDLRMILYYPENAEQFTLDEVSGVWVIKGPDPINADQLGLIRDKISGMRSDVLAGKKPISREAVVPAPSTVVVRKPSPEESNINRAPVPVPADEVLEHAKERNDRDLRPNIVEQKEVTDNLAEITPRGDVVHYVTFEEENLKVVARWYTGEWSNSERLARVNNMKADRNLKVGDTIIIPSYMVKNKTRMTEPAMKALEVLMHEERAG